MSTSSIIQWTENGEPLTARWHSGNGAPPNRVVTLDDRNSADEAYGLACQGTALLWRGDFQNARQMLIALANRADRHSRRSRTAPAAAAATISAAQFHRYRQARAQRARTLGMLLVLLDGNYQLPLRRAPDVRTACLEAFGPAQGATMMSLRALLGVIGAHEWRSRGIDIPAVGGRIHPHYGVFAPIRSEYVDLVASTSLPTFSAARSVAFDVGTGTGVLAAVLARRGIGRVVATDLEPRALACARENLERLGLAQQVEVVQADLFPPGPAALVVCNPPWLPARPTSTLEEAIYDPESRMLRGFLNALPGHLDCDGEGWLILSDLAEHLGLRSREELLAAMDAAGLKVLGRHDIRPRHPKAGDETDPLHRARAAEVTSLWRLAAR
jgi:SAM-dependent methyltransferase